jgi:hypothetical protein
MFFNGWTSLGRMVIVGLLAYVSLIVLLRISGKRTLAKTHGVSLIARARRFSHVVGLLPSAQCRTVLDRWAGLIVTKNRQPILRSMPANFAIVSPRT